MKKFNVYFSMPVHFRVEVEADNEEEAEDAALEFACLTSYAGNGSVAGKLVGTSEKFIHIEPGDEVLDGNGFSVTVEESEK